MGEPEVELVHCIVWNTGMGWEGGVGLCSICWKGRGMDGWMDVVVLDSPAGETTLATDLARPRCSIALLISTERPPSW